MGLGANRVFIVAATQTAIGTGRNTSRALHARQHAHAYRLAQEVGIAIKIRHTLAVATAPTIEQSIRALFPSEAAVAYSAECPDNATLMADEQTCTHNMVEKRRREFVHGRHCARLAMSKLGVKAAAILKNDDRSPAWPAGIIGSITHTHSLAAAVVAPSTHFRGLGLDIEVADALSDDLYPLILRPEERAKADGMHAKMLFSIKETIYKCIYPVVGMFVDFQEMGVALDENAGTFRALPYAEKWRPELIAGLEGRFVRNAEWVISAAWLR